MHRLPPAVAAVLAVAGGLASPGLAGTGGLGPVSPASPNAGRVADAYWLIAGFALLVLLLVVVPLAVFVARYRSRGRDRTVEGPQIRGNTGFELAWTALPVVILFVIATFVFYKLPGITDPKASAAGDRVPVTVEGRQFYWRYVYPNGAIAIDELRVPQGREVELAITAPDGDVIHSYWVPALFGKRDAIPGHETTLRFVASRPGVYEGRCGEFCGIQHAFMQATIRAVPAEEFDAWLRETGRAQQAGSSDLGEQLWRGACLKCHRVDGTYVGPALGGNPTLRDRQALEQIVRNGRGAMPAVGQGWTDREIAALSRFVRANVVGEGGGGGGTG